MLEMKLKRSTGHSVLLVLVCRGGIEVYDIWSLKLLEFFQFHASSFT